MFFEVKTENKVEKQLNEWYWLAITGAIVAQAHIVKGWIGHSWRRGWENCTLDFSLLSEFVYMWKTLHCFPTEEIVIQFITSVLLLLSWLQWCCSGVTAIFITTDWWLLFSFNCNGPTVFCWFSCSQSVLVIFLSSGLATLVSQSAFSFPFTQSFEISACVTSSSSSFSLHSEEWGACTLTALLWKQTCHWIKQSWVLACVFWMCEVNNTGTTRISLSRTFIWSCDPALWANWILLSWWLFHCRRIINKFNKHTWRAIKVLKDSVLPYCFY